MAKTCGYCGATVEDRSIFCTKCGQRITSVSLSNRKKCPNCGQWLSPGKNSCLYCGYSPEEQSEETGSGRFSEEKSDRFTPVSVSEKYREPEPAQNPEPAQTPEPVREPEPVPWSNPYQAEGVKTRLCPGCNRPVEDGFQYCIICGTPVPADESAQNASDSETHSTGSASEGWQDTSFWNQKEVPADDYPGSSLFHTYEEDADQTTAQDPPQNNLSSGKQGGDSLYPTDLFQFGDYGAPGKAKDVPENKAPAQETPPVRGGIYDAPVEPSQVPGGIYDAPAEPSQVIEGDYVPSFDPSASAGDDHEPPVEPSQVPDGIYDAPVEPSPVPGDIYDAPVEPSPVPGDIYDAPVEPSPDTSSHGEPPFTSDFSSDFWNSGMTSEKEEPAESPDPAPAKGGPADAAPEEEESGGSSLFISSDLLRAMKKTEEEDEIPMGFSAPTKL